MGTLKINGTIKLNQFWPEGNSDADTTKMIVTVDPTSFKHNGKATSIYFNALAKEKNDKKKVVTRNRITIRLQGIYRG